MDISSKMFSFIDREHNYLVHFFDSGNLFEFLDIIHHYSPESKNISDSFLLNFIPLIVFLKAGEHLGIYIDSQDPKFFFKLESNSSGQFRAMLLPEDFSKTEINISGQCRINKYFPGNFIPYISQIELSSQSLNEICSKILKLSYQMDAKVIISDNKKYAYLINKIPKSNIDRIETETTKDIDDFIQIRADLWKIFKNFSGTNFESLRHEVDKQGLTYLIERKIAFTCNCSREQFLPSLKQIYNQEGASLFKDNSITITCDYCKSIYSFTQQDLINYQIN